MAKKWRKYKKDLDAITAGTLVKELEKTSDKVWGKTVTTTNILTRFTVWVK